MHSTANSSGGKKCLMKIRVLYEEHIKNGHKVYTTIDIPDGDYSIMLDIDYEQRLAEAEPEKKAEVKHCETVQEMFDLMNNREYNDWRREHRYIDPNPKAKNVNRTFKNFSRFSNGKGLAAEDVAALIMHGAGIYDVRIEHIRGNLTDHYSPTKRFCDYLIVCTAQLQLPRLE